MTRTFIFLYWDFAKVPLLYIALHEEVEEYWKYRKTNHKLNYKEVNMGVKEALDWMYRHHRSKRYHYGMTTRYGNPNFDCSSYVYYAPISGGDLPEGSYTGNTEVLFKLKGKYLNEIYSYKDVRPGDIFIRGWESTYAGAGDRKGMFYKKEGIVHSNYTNDGISYNDADGYRLISYISWSGQRMYVAYRRLSGDTRPWLAF